MKFIIIILFLRKGHMEDINLFPFLSRIEELYNNIYKEFNLIIIYLCFILIFIDFF